MKEKQKFANGELIRPLLSFQKSNFPPIFHFEDWTNQENHYLRNRIRNEYFPLLEQENPQFRKHLIELGTEISQMQDALAYLTKNIVATNLQEFQSQPYSVQSFLLQAYLKKFPDLQLSKAQFSDILAILNKQSNYQQPLKAGYELYKDYDSFEIRKISQVPVLMLTAFQDEEYKMSAFASLADGYLEKPFSLSLLKVRVDAIFKRYYDKGRVFIYKDTRVDFESYSASLAGEEVAINAKELEILDYLVKNEGCVLTRTQIIDAVWKATDEVPFERVIDVYIKGLRKKLHLDCIHTVRNVGYKLERK